MGCKYRPLSSIAIACDWLIGFGDDLFSETSTIWVVGCCIYPQSCDWASIGAHADRSPIYLTVALGVLVLVQILRCRCYTLPQMLDDCTSQTPPLLQAMHPLPSEPIRGAAPLHSTGPSLGAWAPQGSQQQMPNPVTAGAATSVPTAPPALQTASPSLAPHGPLDTTCQSQQKQRAQTRQPSQNTLAADVDPTQSALWADLAAELRSAPISAPVDHHAEAVDLLRSAAASDLPASASGSQQAANWDQSAKNDIRAGSAAAAAAAAGLRVKAVGKDDTPAATPKPPRQTRRKLISGEAASEATDTAHDSNPAAAKTKKNQVRKAARAPKPESRSKAADSTLVSAEQNPSAAEESEAEDVGKGDPSRQAKNAAFKGSGALGLSRRLSSRLLTPQEVNIMAKLPLPPVLERLDKVLFPPVNGMYGFLLRQHIQVGWHIYIQ